MFRGKGVFISEGSCSKVSNVPFAISIQLLSYRSHSRHDIIVYDGNIFGVWKILGY
jgi:hypothetical protein